MARTTLPVVWVTGASKGIGRAIAERFARGGARVALSSRDREMLEKIRRTIVHHGGEAVGTACNVADPRSVARAARIIEQKFGRVDVLVNNAGISPVVPFLETSVGDFDETIAINLRGMFLCSQAVAPGMMRRRSGTIVNILSTAAHRAFSGNAAYCASKAGALGLTRVMRTELKRHGIRVIGVSPGAVETEMWDAAERKKYRARMLQPGDVAEAVYGAVMLHPRAVAEEIILRPIGGDL